MALESKQMRQKDHSSVSSNALLLVVVGKKDPSKPWNQSIRINYSKQYRRFCLPSWRGRRGCYHHYQGHGRGAQGCPHGAGEETKVRRLRKFWPVETGEYEQEGQVGSGVCEPIDGCSSERGTATGGERVSQALASALRLVTCEHVIQVRGTMEELTCSRRVGRMLELDPRLTAPI